MSKVYNNQLINSPSQAASFGSGHFKYWECFSRTWRTKVFALWKILRQPSMPHTVLNSSVECLVFIWVNKIHNWSAEKQAQKVHFQAMIFPIRVAGENISTCSDVNCQRGTNDTVLLVTRDSIRYLTTSFFPLCAVGCDGDGVRSEHGRRGGIPLL